MIKRNQIMWLLIASSVFLFMQCAAQKFRTKFLVGSWQGIEIKEEGELLKVDPASVRFVFGQDKSYHYRSTLNYTESGSYYIESKYLFTLDTVNQASSEKAVEIVQLSEDSLTLKMNDSGKERLLRLIRVQQFK